MAGPMTQRASMASLLTRDEERDLIARAQAGDRAARDRLILSHERLAVAFAYKMRNYGIEVEDLAQEGIIGLGRAVDRFDLGQPFRFATYASWWVKAAIRTAVLRDAGAVRLPTDAASKALFYGLRSASAKLERAGVPRASITQRVAKVFGVAPAIVELTAAQLAFGANPSLNAPVLDGERARIDTLPDPAALPDASAERVIDGVRNKDWITAAFAELTVRERAIVVARHYVDDGEELTLGELGERFGISRERVRQIEARALAKLRSKLSEPEPVVDPQA